MPVFRAMQNGERRIGISLFLVDEGIDTGRVLLKEYLDIREKSMHEVIRKSKKIAMGMIVEFLKDIETKILLDLRDSNDEGSYFSFPNKKDIIEFRERGKKFLMNILTFDLEEWHHLLDIKLDLTEKQREHSILAAFTEDILESLKTIILKQLFSV